MYVQNPFHGHQMKIIRPTQILAETVAGVMGECHKVYSSSSWVTLGLRSLFELFKFVLSFALTRVVTTSLISGVNSDVFGVNGLTES